MYSSFDYFWNSNFPNFGNFCFLFRRSFKAWLRLDVESAVIINDEEYYDYFYLFIGYYLTKIMLVWYLPQMHNNLFGYFSYSKNSLNPR